MQMASQQPLTCPQRHKSPGVWTSGQWGQPPQKDQDGSLRDWGPNIPPFLPPSSFLHKVNSVESVCSSCFLHQTDVRSSLAPLFQGGGTPLWILFFFTHRSLVLDSGLNPFTYIISLHTYNDPEEDHCSIFSHTKWEEAERRHLTHPE